MKGFAQCCRRSWKRDVALTGRNNLAEVKICWGDRHWERFVVPIHVIRHEFNEEVQHLGHP
jgi:hypothetical protein